MRSLSGYRGVIHPQHPCRLHVLASKAAVVLATETSTQISRRAESSTLQHRHEASYSHHCSIVWSCNSSIELNCCSKWLLNILYPMFILIRAPNHRYCRSCTNEPPPLEQFYLRTKQIILLLHHLMNPCHFCHMIILIIEHLESFSKINKASHPRRHPKSQGIGSGQIRWKTDQSRCTRKH